MMLCILATQATPRDGSCNFELSQSDFDDGTVRLRESGTYCVTEDIEFNPRASWLESANEEGAYHPVNDSAFPGSVSLRDGGYALGFFAAIAIEADSVTVDLCGFSIAFGFDFYLQQRFGAIVEIANQPFLPGVGPGTSFGANFSFVDNVVIRNGTLGLSSHHGVHSNGASNVLMEDLVIRDFEVCGVQMNGFQNVTLLNLDVGPSLHSVPLSGYYSNARFLLLALRRLIEEYESTEGVAPSTTFDGNRTMTLRDIEEDLAHSMDLVFGVLTGSISESAASFDELYEAANDLFLNHEGGLPDGSAVYGVVLNSHSVAVGGFGASLNEEVEHGQNATISNVHVHDLSLRVNEVPALYFDRCGDGDNDSMTANKGPFGDVFDLRKAVSFDEAILIEEHGVDSSSLSGIVYEGNPLSDAQIALSMHGRVGVDGVDSYSFGTAIAVELEEWAQGLAPFPTHCADFVCNGDVMFHQNKGLIAVRMDGIEDAVLSDLTIAHLENHTPLVSFACGSYSGAHDGGLAGTTPDDGGMATDSKAIAVTGGDTEIRGNNNSITDVHSHYGDTTALHAMHDAVLYFDFDATVTIDDISSADELTEAEYLMLFLLETVPFPNNFDLCTVQYSDNATVTGDVPTSLLQTLCLEFDPSVFDSVYS